jgi:hypothetical protein
MQMTQLTERQAYLAMFAFLETQYHSTGSSDIGALLGSLALLPDGSPADSAHKEEWNASVKAAVSGQVNAGFSLGG